MRGTCCERLREAIELAAAETGLLAELFPAQCPTR